MRLRERKRKRKGWEGRLTHIHSYTHTHTYTHTLSGISCQRYLCCQHDWDICPCCAHYLARTTAAVRHVPRSQVATAAFTHALPSPTPPCCSAACHANAFQSSSACMLVTLYFFSSGALMTGVQVGFCGSLTTVSSMINDAHKLSCSASPGEPMQEHMRPNPTGTHT